jgi:hypothetical protein
MVVSNVSDEQTVRTCVAWPDSQVLHIARPIPGNSNGAERAARLVRNEEPPGISRIIDVIEAAGKPT